MRSNDKLRKKAEDLARNKAAGPSQNEQSRSPEEAQQLIHELRVHQIELELQNEELRRAQSELDAAGARYFDFYDLAPVGYFTLSQQGMIMEANLTAAALLNVARRDLVNQPFSRYIFKEDMDIYYQHINIIFETATPKTWESRMLNKDRTTFWARVDGIAAKDADGTPTCRIVMSDITDSKRTEKELQLQEKRLRLALISSQQGWFDLDIPTSEVRVSPEYVMMLGYEPGEFNTNLQGWIEGMHPEDRAAVLKVFQECLKTGEIRTMEYRRQTKNGNWIWLRSIGKVVAFDAEHRPLRMIGTHADITERKRTEETLRISEAKYRALIDNLTVGVVVHGPDTSILFSNTMAQSLLGLTEDQMMGKTAMDPHWHFFKEDGNPLSLEEYPINSVVWTGKSLKNLVRGVRHQDRAELVWLLCSAYPVFDEKGQLLQAVVIFVDITERKQADEQIARSLQEKEVLLKEIHHRVKNNMTVIYSLLNLQASDTEDKAARAILEEARDRVNMMALIHKKLYQSKDLAHIDYKEYLQNLATGIADTYQRRDVVVSVDMESVFFDVTVGIPCGLIVNELITNSLKYAFPEGRKGTIRVGINKDGAGNNVLTVADNGAGFPDTVDFRNTTSLGLQLVNILSGQIQGKIELVRNAGTTFRITFPGTTEH